MAYEPDAQNDEPQDWDTGSVIYDDEPVTADECIRKARELLAEWKDSPAVDSLVARDLDNASELLTRALYVDDTEGDL
jgi:hypothetical protein